MQHVPGILLSSKFFDTEGLLTCKRKDPPVKSFLGVLYLANKEEASSCPLLS